MSPIIYVAIGFLLGVVFAKRWFDSQTRVHHEHGHKIPNPEQTERKNQHLAEIMQLLSVQSEITNDWVEKSLGVSDATAERYLQELEDQGKIEQIGRTGHTVKYARK